jgi:hypothetical protein
LGKASIALDYATAQMKRAAEMQQQEQQSRNSRSN